MKREELLRIIQQRYPDEDNTTLSKELGISESALRTIASRNNINKSPTYKRQAHQALIAARKKAWEDNIKPMEVGIEEQNIIVGSLLGDGSLALYGRSRNARYREHGAITQLPYRRWKANRLSKQGFRLNPTNGQLSSPSHPYFTHLYHLFYPNGEKTLNEENLKLLNHIIGLACLYMDDGSLIIDSTRRKNEVILFPRIYLYSLCYSNKENELLAEHILKQFKIAFKIKKHPDGTGFMLEINRRNDVVSFINLIKPYVLEVPVLSYKVAINQQLILTSQRYAKRDYSTSIAPLEIIDNTYTNEDVNTIIMMKKSGFTDKEIATSIGRSYWGIVDKIRRLRQEGLI